MPIATDLTFECLALCKTNTNTPTRLFSVILFECYRNKKKSENDVKDLELCLTAREKLYKTRKIPCLPLIMNGRPYGLFVYFESYFWSRYFRLSFIRNFNGST